MNKKSKLKNLIERMVRREVRKQILKENAASQNFDFVKALEDFPWETVPLMDPQEREALVNFLKQQLARMDDVDDDIELDGMSADKFRDLLRTTIDKFEKAV